MQKRYNTAGSTFCGMHDENKYVERISGMESRKGLPLMLNFCPICTLDGTPKSETLVPITATVFVVFSWVLEWNSSTHVCVPSLAKTMSVNSVKPRDDDLVTVMACDSDSNTAFPQAVTRMTIVCDVRLSITAVYWLSIRWTVCTKRKYGAFNHDASEKFLYAWIVRCVFKNESVRWIVFKTHHVVQTLILKE